MNTSSTEHRVVLARQYAKIEPSPLVDFLKRCDINVLAQEIAPRIPQFEGLFRNLRLTCKAINQRMLDLSSNDHSPVAWPLTAGSIVNLGILKEESKKLLSKYTAFRMSDLCALAEFAKHVDLFSHAKVLFLDKIKVADTNIKTVKRALALIKKTNPEIKVKYRTDFFPEMPVLLKDAGLDLYDCEAVYLRDLNQFDVFFETELAKNEYHLELTLPFELMLSAHQDQEVLDKMNNLIVTGGKRVQYGYYIGEGTKLPELLNYRAFEAENCIGLSVDGLSVPWDYFIKELHSFPNLKFLNLTTLDLENDDTAKKFYEGLAKVCKVCQRLEGLKLGLIHVGLDLSCISELPVLKFLEFSRRPKSVGKVIFPEYLPSLKLLVIGDGNRLPPESYVLPTEMQWLGHKTVDGDDDIILGVDHKPVFAFSEVMAFRPNW